VGNEAESHRQTNTLRSTKLSANPVTSESEYVKGWTNEESWFCYRKRQFARSVQGATQSPLHWLMEISGRGMKLTAHLNLAPRSRVHGAIYPPTHRPSYIVQVLYLFLHFVWHTLPLLVLQVASWAILRLPISAMLRRHSFTVGNYLYTELQ
jgi:hypothetical protein